MITIPFSSTTGETELSLRRIAFFAGGIALALGCVVGVIAVRFAAFGIGHRDVPFTQHLRTLLGW